jgi:hypothetical protein
MRAARGGTLFVGALLFVLFVGLFVGAGCNNPVYLAENRALETMAAAMGNGFAGDTDLYVLPIRQPTATERRALETEQMKRQLPNAVPWVGVRDVAVEIAWSVKNLEMMPVQATVSLDGGNEFGDYVPAAYVNPTAAQQDQATPPPLLGGTPFDLAVGEVRTGVFREDDLEEAASKLEVITRYPTPGAGMNVPFIVIEHDSRVSRVGLDAVPPNDVTPAMVRYVFNLAANGHVVLDYNVRVRDLTGRLAPPSAKNLYVSTAPMLQAPAAPAPPP